MSVKAAAIKVMGSFAVPPKSMWPSKRDAAKGHGTPTASPARVRSNVSRKTISEIEFREALSAVGAADASSCTIPQHHLEFAVRNGSSCKMLSIFTIADRWIRTKRAGSILAMTSLNEAR
jgi:hypothetical protein